MRRVIVIATAGLLACAGACEKSPNARGGGENPTGGGASSSRGAPPREQEKTGTEQGPASLVEMLEPPAPPAPHSPTPADGVPPGDSAAALARSFAEFKPSLHGFAFVNAFEGSPLPFELPGLEKKLNIPNRFGLCGGMSFAAADYFLARRAIPGEIRTPPERGSNLYGYLYARQSASLGLYGSMSFKFLEWMQLPDAGPGGTRARTAAGLGSIRDKIADGRPVVLGLVLSGGKGGALWENHQVLAFAWEGPDSPSAGAPSRIRVYDPNFPGRDDVVIRCEREGEGVTCVRSGGGRREMPIRGVFEMAYIAATPPTDR